MKILPGNGKASGLTLIEVLAILAILAILAALLLPDLLQRRRPYRGLSCASNLKQIGIAYIMWEEDHGGKFPAQIPSAEKGSMEMISSGYACLQFRPLSPYMPRNIWAFACPADKTKFAATNYNPLLEENVSYFANVDATTSNPVNTILAGDRHLLANGRPVKPGLFTFTNYTSMGWTLELHGNQGYHPFGFIGFADGHVQGEWDKDNALTTLFQEQPLISERLTVP